MFRIATDSTADLPEDFLQEKGISCVNLSYILDGVTYGGEKVLDAKDFYAKMRAGQMPTTSQVNPEDAKAFFLEIAETEKEILMIAFSSGLSGSYNAMQIAAQEVMEERPDCRIRVIDSLCASLGEGMFVYKAAELRDQGLSMDETAAWLEENKLNFVHVFTVDDLFHLCRGGRVSRTAAVVGTLVGIKPVLHVDDEGHLINISKIRGRKKALQELVNYMQKKQENYDGGKDIIMIAHGDCLEDAEYVRDLVRERFGVENIWINMLGPVIGAHTGPGLMALFFMGESR